MAAVWRGLRNMVVSFGVTKHNNALQLTAYSLRSYVAPAFGSS